MFILLRSTGWTDAAKDDLMRVHLKTILLLHVLIDVLNRADVHIKNGVAALAHKVIVLHQPVVIPGGVALNLQGHQIALLREGLQVAVYGGLADGGVLGMDGLVNLLRGRVLVQAGEGIQDDLPLNGGAHAAVLSDKHSY